MADERILAVLENDADRIDLVFVRGGALLTAPLA
jgi:hypothetical protein